MSRERKLGIVATVGAIIVAYLTITASVRAELNERYVTKDELANLKSDVRVIKCAIRPDLCLSTQP